MLNISFQACTKVGKWRKISKSHHDLELDPTMPIIELVQDISYTTMYSNFMFLDQ